MKQINFNHLQYFYHVAREGGINKAAAILHVTPQTVSGQLNSMEDYLGFPLFHRQGKKLVMTELGQVTYRYAENIFSLGKDLMNVLSTGDIGGELNFKVGILDSIPKILAYDLLRSCYGLDEGIHLQVREGNFDYLLSEFAIDRLNMVISDRPIPPGISVKGQSRLLVESGYSFFAAGDLASRVRSAFPDSLHREPFLTPGDATLQKNIVLSWLGAKGIYPKIIGEYDDTALMKIFGQGGYGVFFTPSIIETFILSQYSVQLIGRITEIKDQFYAITPNRKFIHPAITLIVEEAHKLSNTIVEDNY